MDLIISDHSTDNLEKIFESEFILQTENYSLLCKTTDIPWMQFIPKKPLSSPAFAGKIYAEIHEIAEKLKGEKLGKHFNIAKIGNKLPYYHIHLVYRHKEDERWPEPIWCQDGLKKNNNTPQVIRDLLLPE